MVSYSDKRSSFSGGILGRIDARLALGFFAVLTAYWLILVSQQANTGPIAQTFSGVYGLLSLFGGIVGLRIGFRWGGAKTLLGRASLFLASGLLLQFLGQVAYTYHILVLNDDIPYPSLGDIGYFGSTVAYLLGAVHVARASGLKMSRLSLRNLLVGVLVIASLLTLSVSNFLWHYAPDWSFPLKTLLDFGYPVVQAAYVAIGIIGLSVSSQTRGGALRFPLTLLLLALAFQYLCDFLFLLEANRGTWQSGNLNDFMYFVSYLAMTLALLSLDTSLRRVRQSK